MNDDELRGVLTEMRDLLRGLAAELERYRGLLPEPGSIKARLLRHKVAASAVEHWQNGD